MTITTYTDLVNAVEDYLDRNDLASRASTFIQLAEARLNRLLDDPAMETTVTVAVTAGSGTLPADFGTMVSISAGYVTPLKEISAAQYAAMVNSGETGNPRLYTIIGDTVRLYPAVDSSLTLVYRRTVTPLSPSAPINWLLTDAPDVYLYGTLLQAEAFLAEDDRLSVWKAAYEEAISDLNSNGDKRRWGMAPIVPRLART